ncbi:AraC family transcriptional regulator [Flavitalea antarctica]
MRKPRLLTVNAQQTSSFDIRYEKVAYFDNPWHYHPEYELTLVTNSRGIRFVGDCVEPFREGDLVLLGSHLPHYWRNYEEYYHEDSNLTAEACILRFKPSLLEINLNMPETTAIQKLFKKSSRGILFGELIAQKIEHQMVALTQQSGAERLISFLQIMHFLSGVPETRLLSSIEFGAGRPEADKGRMDSVLNYIHQHIQDDIPLQEIAAYVHMNPAAFCRYIKSRTNKTFLELVNEIRISNACRLLLDDHATISNIAHASGFKNVTHFNYTFKKVMGRNPSDFKKA